MKVVDPPAARQPCIYRPGFEGPPDQKDCLEPAIPVQVGKCGLSDLPVLRAFPSDNVATSDFETAIYQSESLGPALSIKIRRSLFIRGFIAAS